VFSVPKMFPVQVGGLLICNRQEYKMHPDLERPLETYIKNVMSNYIFEKETIQSQRIHSYKYLQNNFLSLGFEPRFELLDGVIPGVFMFRCNDQRVDLGLLKEHFYAHGIQCSVFYGEESFFVPCHQALKTEDLDYFIAVVKSFMFKLN
jgi:hypothetical protein